MRKASDRKLRELIARSRKDDTEGWIEEVETSGSDRAAAILCATRIEVALEEVIFCLLPNCFDEEKTKPAELFGDYRPIQGFGAKIDMAFWLGAISEEARDELRLIKKIRNAFAHGGSGIDFTSKEIMDVIVGIKSSKNYLEDHMTVRESFMCSTLLIVRTIQNITCVKLRAQIRKLKRKIGKSMVAIEKK